MVKHSVVALLTLFSLGHLREGCARPPAFTGKELAQMGAAYEKSIREGRRLSEHEERQANYFAGYVEGAALASRKICLPSTPGVRDQLSAATAKYLREHAREWSAPPDALVVRAVQPLYPCTVAKTGKR